MSEPERPPPGGRDREGLDERQVRQIAMIGALVLVASIVLVFIVENSRQVRVSFVFFSSEMSLIWVIILSVAVGAVLGVVGSRLVRRRLLKRD